MSAVYSIFTSPTHAPVPNHLPTLIVTPHGRPAHILYTYLHTNQNRENYLLTPSDSGDLCVAKLFPPPNMHSSRSSSNSHGSGGSNAIQCEASRNLRWSMTNTGIQNPVYKALLNQDDQDQPLFQVSKPNPHAGWWTLFYFTYAGHLIPPRRVEFGKIYKNPPESGGGTRVSITGKSEEEKAVWKTLGEGNEDMVEWIVLSAALTVLDDEIVHAAEKAGLGLTAGPVGAKARPALAPSPRPTPASSPRPTPAPSPRPTPGSTQSPHQSAPLAFPPTPQPTQSNGPRHPDPSRRPRSPAPPQPDQGARPLAPPQAGPPRRPTVPVSVPSSSGSGRTVAVSVPSSSRSRAPPLSPAPPSPRQPPPTQRPPRSRSPHPPPIPMSGGYQLAPPASPGGRGYAADPRVAQQPAYGGSAGPSPLANGYAPSPPMTHQLQGFAPDPRDPRYHQQPAYPDPRYPSSAPDPRFLQRQAAPPDPRYQHPSPGPQYQQFSHSPQQHPSPHPQETYYQQSPVPSSSSNSAGVGRQPSSYLPGPPSQQVNVASRMPQRPVDGARH